MTKEQNVSKELIHYEIERKFLIENPNNLPFKLDELQKIDIEQTYLYSSFNTEIRLRKESRQNENDKYYIYTKKGTGNKRIEEEAILTKPIYDELLKSLSPEKTLIKKTRHLLPYNDLTIEIDLYHNDHLEGLCTAEIEFETEIQNNNFIVPSWLNKEVTYDEKFKNKYLIHQNPIEKNKPLIEITVPIYQKEEGVSHLIELIDKANKTSKEPIIVALAGGSASGKTTIANFLYDYFKKDSIILTMDDYYLGNKFMEEYKKETGITLNYDQPEVVNISLIKEHLIALKNGETILKPNYSMLTGELLEPNRLKPAKIIFLEGLFALNNEIKDQSDIKVFTDIGTHGRIIRRLMRDVTRTSFSPQDILSYFSSIVEPMHEKYIQTTINNADFVINNEYMPNIEASRSRKKEYQQKFETNLTEKDLEDIGADRILKTPQVDYYYNPFDRDLAKTGESLRIREESGDLILAYKGPNTGTNEINRPKFEFQITPDIKDKFTNMYGKCIKTISKMRTIYQLDNVIFHYDLIGNNQKTYIEFISQPAKELLDKLKINPNSTINKAYIEMLYYPL